MGASLIAQLVKNPLAVQETQFDSWVRKIPWRRDRLPTPVLLGFPSNSADKESTCNARDSSLIPGLGRSSGDGIGFPLQYSCLENPHGLKSLAGYSSWGCQELDTTEQLLLHFTVRKPQGLDSSAPQKEYVLYLRLMLRAGGREDAQQSDLTVN